jgi:hypothetical protein
MLCCGKDLKEVFFPPTGDGIDYQEVKQSDSNFD